MKKTTNKNLPHLSELLHSKKAMSYINICTVIILLAILISVLMNFSLVFNVAVSQRITAKHALDQYIEQNTLDIYQEIKQNASQMQNLNPDDFTSILKTDQALIKNQNELLYKDSSGKTIYKISDIRLSYDVQDMPKLKLEYHLHIPMQFIGEIAFWTDIPVALHSQYNPKF